MPSRLGQNGKNKLLLPLVFMVSSIYDWQGKMSDSSFVMKNLNVLVLLHTSRICYTDL